MTETLPIATSLVPATLPSHQGILMSETKPLPETKFALELIMRGLRQPKVDKGVIRHKASNPLEGLDAMLAIKDFAKPEPLIGWQGADAVQRLAALDLDYHGNHKPAPRSLEGDPLFLPFTPARWWRTHGGGLRAIFTATEGFDANELAAAWAALFLYGPKTKGDLWTYGLTGVEIKTETRHPAYPKQDGSTCSTVFRGSEIARLSALRDLLAPEYAEVDPDAVEEWLQENGFEMGHAYEHDRCLINPGAYSHGKPVWVGDYGINCLSCAAKDWDGFRSWGRLVGDRPAKPSRLKAMVRYCTHWEHARHVVAVEWPALPPKLGELAFRALLKLWHVEPDDPHHEAKASLVAKVFFPDLPLVRGVSGAWVQAADLATPVNRDALDGLIQSLPAVQFVDRDKGKVGISKRMVSIFKDTADLTAYGYPPVQPLIGCDLRPPADEEPEDVVLAVVPARKAPFVYVPAAKRNVDVDEKLSSGFPGINVRLLRLLIAAKGFAQAQPIEPPLIAVTGQSSAGKTATCLLAAEIACDALEHGRMPDSVEEFLRAVGATCGRRDFFLVDEVAKSRVTPAELEAALLALKRGGQYRALYRGHVAFGPLPVIILADTFLPPIFRESIQLARRVVHVDLGAGGCGARDWRTTAGEIVGWRSAYPGLNRPLADALLSEVRDFLWQPDGVCRPLTFHEAAERLGFPTLDKASADVDPNADLLELFDAVCAAPDACHSRWRGPGWKVFRPEEATPLATAWRACTEGGDVQRVTGARWPLLLDKAGVELDYSPHGRQIGLRFRIGAPGKSAVLNGDIAPERKAATPDVLPLAPLPAAGAGFVTVTGAVTAGG
jgi:hypothetical protein